MTSTEPVLRLEHVSKVFSTNIDRARTYGILDMAIPRRRGASSLRPSEWVALQDVSLRVDPGESVAVLGSRGSGKTTLAKIICGVLRPDEGVVAVRGRAALISGAKLGVNAYMTVWEYVRLATALHGIGPDRADEVSESIIRLADLPGARKVHVADVPKTAIRLLSLGAALAADADLWVFDGVFSASGSPAADRINERLQEVLETRTVLVFAPDARRVPKRVDRAVILHDGEILYRGRPAVALPTFDKFAQALRIDATRADEGGPDDGAAGADPGDVAARRERAAGLMRRISTRTAGVQVNLAAESEIERMWAGGRPMLLGPYVSDVGLELLYWVPFLAWVRHRFGERRAPVVAMSRARAGAWYKRFTTGYLDAFDLMSAGAFAERNAARIREVGSVKQMSTSAFEAELARQAVERLGWDQLEQLHPSVMFNLTAKVWRGRLPAADLAEFLHFERFAPVGDAEHVEGLPADYVAASVGFTGCFRDRPAHRDLLRALVGEITRHVPVAVMDGPAFLREERATIDGGRGLHFFDPDAIGRELDVQTRVIGRARGVLAVYGGPALMAPFLGVPALTFYAEEVGYFGLHTSFTDRAAAAMPGTVMARLALDALEPGRVWDWFERAREIDPRRAGAGA